MHELVATENILNIVLSKATEISADRITRVSIKAGEWSGFEPECVEYYFHIISRGTIAEDAEIEITTIPVKFRCADCGVEYEPSQSSFRCSHCGAAKGTLISGREFYVEAIEVRHESKNR